ncbi:Ig-like domain-containing protein [Mycobacterium sp. NPDC006124]|uniref:Ig-like domain-containing protein n=1 Tax=Mycobacterium sp. NPDC006124 TaxID=3156729 RepID=UPI0033B6537B
MTGSSDPYSDAINYHVAGFFGAVQALIAGAPLPDPLKAALSGTAYTVRRSLYNSAPTVTPLQLTGTSDTAVAGRVSASDPDGDQIAYRVVQGPASGTLQLNSDGSFTYTPGDGFDGVASFVVLAQDLGLHVNLLNPFRGPGTSAGALVNEGAIKFDFNYTTGANFWSDEARAALASSANRVTAYFLVTRPVTLTYDVTGEDSTASSKLASAGSGLVSTDPGFWQTVVQSKLLTGVDANGDAADGSIDWNFAKGWDYGDSVSADNYDFVSTAMHELMHSFGFLSVIDAPGKNADGEWTVLDGFIQTSGGAKPVTYDYRWNAAYDPNLTGAAGGFYFGGANAVAAYGGLVPLYTPNPWEDGSSMSHLDDTTFTGANEQMMNAKTDTGLGVRVLSPIELGILKDIGYTVVIPSVAPSAASVAV